MKTKTKTRAGVTVTWRIVFFDPEDESTVCQHEEQTNRMFKRFAFMQRAADSVISNERERARLEIAGDLEMDP